MANWRNTGRSHNLESSDMANSPMVYVMVSFHAYKCYRGVCRIRETVGNQLH